MKSSSVLVKSVVAVLLMTAAGPVLAQERPPRTVTVKLALDRAIPDPVNWRCRAAGFLRGPSRALKSRFGLRLVIGDPVRWRPENGRRSLAEALADLRAKVQPEGNDIVLGIISRERISTPRLGIASYPHGYILLSDQSSPRAMEYAFLHEVCHVFGAIDLKNQGSVMSIRDPGLAIDGFTARAVLLHRARSFDRGSFPLAKAAIDEAVALYRERVDRGPGGEPAAYLFLTLLYLEKEDVESAAKACDDAAVSGPDLTGLHVLLGNIRLRKGQTDEAIREYERALGAQPEEPGIHYDLGLAYVQAHRYGQAVAECRAALGIDGDHAEARLLLARLVLAVAPSRPE